MKVVLSILIWVIIGLVIILGVKSIIQSIKKLRQKKNNKNKTPGTDQVEETQNQEQKKGE